MDAILEAAARILRRDGPDALTTNRVSEVAGVSIGGLYGYFPNKTAILVALARRMMAQDEEALVAALADAPAREDVLQALVHTLIERHRADVAVRRAVMSVHHAHGLSMEHSRTAQQAIARILERRPDLSANGAVDPVRLFVLTRALLGVARAMIEEEPEAGPALEAEVVRLARLCLAPTAA